RLLARGTSGEIHESILSRGISEPEPENRSRADKAATRESGSACRPSARDGKLQRRHRETGADGTRLVIGDQTIEICERTEVRAVWSAGSSFKDTTETK